MIRTLGLGRFPGEMRPSPGNILDIRMAGNLVLAAGPIHRLVAERGYDANHLRKRLYERGAEAVIPATTSRRALRSFAHEGTVEP